VLSVTGDDDAPRQAAVLFCAPGRPAGVLWQGSTAWQGEDVGSRTRDEAFVRTAGGRRQVVRGRRAEDSTLCGTGPTLIDPQVLDPATGRFTAVVLDPREDVVGGTTQQVQAQLAPGAPGVVPWAGVRVAAASRPARLAPELSDRVPTTRWQAARLGALTGPVALGGIDVRGIDVLTPSDAALPTRWTLLVAPGPLRVEVEVSAALAMEAARTGGWVRLPLPEGTRPRCVSVIAGVAGSVAEVALHTTLDGHGGDPLRDLARAAGAPEGEAATRLLAQLGTEGLAALSEALPSMSTVGARRAVRFLAAVPDGRVVHALVEALARADVEEAAARALERDGAAALQPLAEALGTNPRAARVLAALRVPAGDRLRALAVGLSAEGEAWVAVRTEIARLLATAAQEPGGGGAEAFLRALPEAPLPAGRGLHLLAMALGPRHPLTAACAAAARTLWNNPSADFPTRWRILRALPGDAEGAVLVRAFVQSSTDPDLRAEGLRALGQWSPGAETDAVLGRALAEDAVPRVRVAAARALHGRAEGSPRLIGALRSDRWPRVRAAAAEALAGRPEALATLLTSLDDNNAVAVRAVLAALGMTPGDGVTPRLLAFVEDHRRDPTLRRDAVDALGARCDAAAAPGLERVAEAHSDGALPPWELEVGQAALASLARVDAARARAWVQRMGSNAAASAAVERAARAGCGGR